MSLNTVVGFPRIGSQRELKFLTEDYFQGKISGEELASGAAKLRESQWLALKEKGVGLIPCGDFSFYDGMLDTAMMLGAVPDEYKKLGLSPLDTYFAMARGYQGEKGDVKALPMRKWFNTNYHYIAPPLDGVLSLALSDTALFGMVTRALSLGVNAKPVLIGPYTFLKLAEGKKERLAAQAAAVYAEVVARLSGLGAAWIQLDEPALALDMNDNDKALFRTLYSALLPAKRQAKMLLQTYFGDIRDIYPDVVRMDFDGIGLDFVEGRQSLSLVKQHGFPKGKTLFAGVINGRNIWRNDYAKSLSLLGALAAFVPRDSIAVSTSCSLLHAPYSLESETAMSDAHKRHFAFAWEKVGELGDLTRLFHGTDGADAGLLVRNTALKNEKRQYDDAKVRAAVARLSETDFTRQPPPGERAALQSRALSLPPLPTTTIGSFPQTKEVKALRGALKNGAISRDEYDRRIREKIAGCIALQERLGLDVLVHGEFERNDMVEYFGENLSGFLFTQKAWVQSYGTRCVKPPIVWGDVQWTKPITVDTISYAQSLTKKPVKGMLTGPITILNWSFPREDVPPRETALQIALAIREEVRALEAAGIRIIQVDEAALKEKLPLRRADWHRDYLDWAIAAFRLVHASVKPETQIHTHMCYSEFDEIIADIDGMDADVITFEAARSQLCIVETLSRAGFQTAVGPGVYDIHSPRVPSENEIRQAIEQMLGLIPKEKLWVNPDCGLKTRGENETERSLKNLVAAAKAARAALPG